MKWTENAAKSRNSWLSIEESNECKCCTSIPTLSGSWSVKFKVQFAVVVVGNAPKERGLNIIFARAELLATILRAQRLANGQLASWPSSPISRSSGGIWPLNSEDSVKLR